VWAKGPSPRESLPRLTGSAVREQWYCHALKGAGARPSGSVENR